MSVIEFQTFIDHGKIELPQEFKNKVHGRARVTVVSEEVAGTDDAIETLLSHPYQISEFKPLTRDEIYGQR